MSSALPFQVELPWQGPGVRFGALDDPLIDECKMPENVWGLGYKDTPYLAAVFEAPMHPWLVGWSICFFSESALARFYGNFLDAPWEEIADTRPIEIKQKDLIEWAHPSAHGMMLLEWDGSEITRVYKDRGDCK